ncbi:FecCD family ABC transporter permease [Pseudoalteromonas sp. T1lg10]|uniref:FecCD family ABC transporter permease n=1 Tax=Pseudoalteromonas sp. T1lg10 TaxID=2077093 RepID=UPI000CF61FA0|nr:iron ABC transporter permease [Pseudoalteromonas sp. T1lg10]
MINQRKIAIVALVFIVPLSALWALKLGAVNLSWSQLLAVLGGEGDPLWQQIIWQLRVPRVALAFMAGAGLALAGAMLQTVTRNPLADPYLFGISSGAALGVVVAMTLLGISAGIMLTLSAFIGAMLATALLLSVALSLRYMQNSIMVLCGVALSFGFSALTSLLLYFSEPQAISAVVFWTLGSFARANLAMLLPIALLLLIVLALVVLLRRALNALLLGDESAHTLGVNVPMLRIIMLLLSALITAVLVSVCGGIGFVGLMIPHLVRLSGRFSSTQVYPLSFVCGGLFMLWVDVLARTMMTNQELPIGVITASLGSAFFFALLYTQQRQHQ